MTTLTISHIRRPAPKHWAILFLLLIIGLSAAIKVISQPHAETRHGEEVKAIRASCDQKDPFQVWRNRDAKTFYQICQLSDNRYCIRVIIKDGEDWIEKTAFVPKDGTLNEVIKYLQEFATRFTGTLP